MTRRSGDYVEKLANDIETKLNMNDDDIRKLTNKEFKDLLKNGYFSRKKYKYGQTEPTNDQMSVLNLYYGKEVYLTTKKIFNVKNTFFNVNKVTQEKCFPTFVRKNKGGRVIDAKTGRFVRIK